MAHVGILREKAVAIADPRCFPKCGTLYCMRALSALGAMFAVGLVAMSPAHADLKQELSARYRKLNAILASKNASAAKAWIDANTTASFTYMSRDKNRFSRDQFLQGLREQMTVTKKVLADSVSIAALSVRGTTATAQVDSKSTALVNFDSRTLKLVDQSHTIDTWVRVQGQWRLSRSVQTTGDTQMFRDESGG